MSEAAATVASADDQQRDQFTQNTQRIGKWFGFLQQRNPRGGTLGLKKGCEFSVGRNTGNSLVIQSLDGLDLSKVQFVIREDRALGGVSIEDRSSNGTFVNGERLSKGKRKPLANNDAIGMAYDKAANFVFISGGMDDQNSTYPQELRIKYAMARELGKGARGAVMLGVRRSDNTQVAIKVMDKEKLKGLPRGVLDEVKLLKAVDHPCIIRLEDVVETDKELFVVMELAEGGDLFERIVSSKRLEEKQAKLYFYQMLEAVKYLHSMNIAHRDLKPENILLSTDQANPVIKVTDVGMSKLSHVGSNPKRFCETPQYLAPEVLSGSAPDSGTYSHACDMWSLGAILYVMLSGTPAFNPERKDKDMVKQITEADYAFPDHIWRTVSVDAIDLIRRLMTLRASDRLTAKAALQHSWLNDPEVLTEAKSLMNSVRRIPTGTQPRNLANAESVLDEFNRSRTADASEDASSDSSTVSFLRTLADSSEMQMALFRVLRFRDDDGSGEKDSDGLSGGRDKETSDSISEKEQDESEATMLELLLAWLQHIEGAEEEEAKEEPVMMQKRPKEKEKKKYLPTFKSLPFPMGTIGNLCKSLKEEAREEEEEEEAEPPEEQALGPAHKILQFLPGIIGNNLVCKSKVRRCKLDTFLLAVYNVHVRNKGKKLAAKGQWEPPRLAEHSSIYHHAKHVERDYIELYVNPPPDIEITPPPLKKVPVPVPVLMSTVNAQNRMQLLQSIMHAYNESLPDYSRIAIEQFVGTWQRLLQRGSGQGKAGASHQPRVLLSSDMLVQLAYTADFCIHNGFQSEGSQMVELIRQRGAALGSHVVLLTVNAISNREKVLNSGPSQQAMTTTTSTPTTSTPTPNQIAKNMITNASFRAKKIGDDIPRVIQLPANSEAEVAAMVSNLKALANMSKINEEVIEEFIKKPSATACGEKKGESETKKKDKTSATDRKDGERVVASAESPTGSSTPPASASVPAMVTSTPAVPASLQSTAAHNK